jgi:hypothetical protein
MVDNTIKTLFKSDKYAYVEYRRSDGEVGRKFVYANGKDLLYGDEAEILGAVMGKDFSPFIHSVLDQNHFTREHYGFTFGFQPADFDNEEIKVNEVRIYYADVENTITKKDFYELCLLMCNAKLKTISSDSDITEQELFSIKSQLEEKIKTF